MNQHPRPTGGRGDLTHLGRPERRRSTRDLRHHQRWGTGCSGRCSFRIGRSTGCGSGGRPGKPLAAPVLTPHIPGIAGFYRLEGDSLNLVAQRPGVTSHTIGSRNLDMGLAGDLDGDGQPELVVFDQSLVELMALRRTEDGIDGAWQTPVGGKAATNLASVDLGGGITLGVGRDDGVLRIWLAP